MISRPLKGSLPHVCRMEMGRAVTPCVATIRKLAVFFYLSGSGLREADSVLLLSTRLLQQHTQSHRACGCQ